MIYKIYALKLKGDSDIRYIGRTVKKLNERFAHHKCDFRRNTHKSNWIKKNKENIEIILIEDNILNLELCNEREMFWIDYYKKFGHRLTNATNGGDGCAGFVMSKKNREMHSNRMKKNNPMFNDDVKKRVHGQMMGRKLSEEHKRKIGISGKRTGMKPLIQYDLIGNKIREWDGPTSVYEEFGYDISSIAKCCKGVQKTSYGFIWKYKNETKL